MTQAPASDTLPSAANAARQPPGIRVMFGGDIMLGRNVKEMILQHGAGYPLGPVADVMRQAGLAIANLECAVTSSTEEWTGEPKAFYFGAPPQAADTLAGAGIDMVSVANNHILDFGVNGLTDTLRYLQGRGIRHAGAGTDIDMALAPAIASCSDVRFGMAAYCDHQEDFAATTSRPGIAYLDLDDEFSAIAEFRKALVPLRRAGIDWPVLALHWGPNMAHRPSHKQRRLAHAAIDMGWKILFGHSAHVFQGIEIYRGRPIVYAAGDLVDDYYVDPDFRNDHQLLFEMELAHDALRRIDLHPVFIENCQVRFATREQAAYIAERMTVLCGELGTRVQRDAGKTWIEGPHA